MSYREGVEQRLWTVLTHKEGMVGALSPHSLVVLGHELPQDQATELVADPQRRGARGVDV